MILVTGASQGIGKNICERLLEKHSDVVGIGREVGHLNFEAYSCDVASYKDLKSLSAFLKKKYSTVSCLVNAAGIASMNLALLTPQTVTEEIIRTNLMGTIFSCQIFSPLLIKNKWGSIINFSTIAVPIGLKGESVYVASKAGVEGFSKSFAREMADFNIRVNCIAPGPIDTNLTKNVSKKLIQKIVDQQIIPKQFSANDVSNLVELLIDKRSETISGQVISPGGI